MKNINLSFPLIILTILLTGCVTSNPIKNSIMSDDLDALVKTINSDKSKINHKDDIGRTPLLWAASQGNIRISRYLVDQGASINATENSGETPLHWAAGANNDSPELVQYLVSNGADVSIRTIDGQTPIHLAAFQGNLEVIKYLVSVGVDINAKDHLGETPLHVAASRGKKNIVKYLVLKGANPNASDNKGATPLHEAAVGGHVEAAKYLVTLGANINANDKNGETPLDKAKKFGEIHIDIVPVLSEKHELASKKDYKGPSEPPVAGSTPPLSDTSPLTWAAENQATIKIAEAAKREELADQKAKEEAILARMTDEKTSKDKLNQEEIQEARRKSIPDKIPPKITITSHDTSRGFVIKEKRKIVMVKGKVEDDSGIGKVLVNNTEATVDKSGNFSTDVFLVKGKNKVLIVAADIHKNKAEKKFTITRIDEKPSKQKVVSTRPSIKYYALIIGNNNYKHIRKLETAINDAKSVMTVLTSIYNFKTQLLLDASRNEIVRAINNYRKILKESDNFLIYYAGHGEFDKTVNKAYWLPIDARADDDTDWILSDRITSNIKRFASNHILIVADSCYSGALTRKGVTNLGSGETRDRYLLKMKRKSSRTLLASGGDEPVSDTGGKGHSVFAAAFIDGLKEMEQKVFTAEELYYEHVKERVAGNAEQTPEYNIIRNSGHSGGDFLFVRGSK